MEHIVDKIFGGYNNHYDLENRFYDDLSIRLRNEPNKIDFLNKLKELIEIELIKHNENCTEEKCSYPKLRDISIKIIDSIIEEKMEQKEIKHIINNDNSINKIDISNSKDVNVKQSINSEHKENWFLKNIKYVYYLLGVLGFIYSFFKWILPLFN
jgi:hypothetical protein